jgi:hypothetical protein
MHKTTIGLTLGTALALFAAQAAHARGFGGARCGGGYSAAESHGGYRGGEDSSGGYRERGAYARGPEDAGAVHGESSDEVYHGAHGTTVAHGSASAQGAAEGPGGAAAGGKEVSATAVKGPEGNEYTHETSAGRGAAAGPGGVEGGRYASAGSTYRGEGDATYAHGTAGYSAAHTALPTDAGYGAPVARTETAAYAGYHQTEAVSGSVAAARGASVRTAFSNPGIYGQDWHAANPGAWAPAGWTAGRAWGTAAWPAVGTTLGWGSIPPVAYNYGTNVTYQDDQVFYGDQPVATAGEYYQQASSLAASVPAAADSGDWLPLGVFALVQKEESDPHYVMHLAINKSGAIGGNYSDLLSGTTVPIQGAVDKRTQRAAWTVGKNKHTVCETGLYNLTQEEAPALIHMGKDKTQQWLLVRLKQPGLAGGEN